MTEPRPSPLGDRIDEVCGVRGLNPRQWSLAAKLSGGYLAAKRSLAGKDHGYVLPERAAVRLAAVARIRVEWLRYGNGARDATEAPNFAPLSREHELALFDAFARGNFSSEDGVAAREVARGIGSVLPPQRGAAAKVMERLLAAVARLRNDGKPVTVESLAGVFLTGEVDSPVFPLTTKVATKR